MQSNGYCMKRPQPLLRGLLVTLLLPLVGLAEERPNILILSVDDLNDFPAFMGRNPDALTPNMDRLASRGVTFANAHTQYPLCGPSRASLMSGLYPSTVGFPSHMKDSELQERAGELGTDLLHSYFAKHGYKTMAVGKICHNHVPLDTVDASGGRGSFNATTGKLGRNWSHSTTSTDWAAAPDRDDQLPDYDAAQWAVERLGESHDDPFLLMVGFLRPHVAWYVPQKWFDLYPNPEELALPPYKADDLEDVSEHARQISLRHGMPSADWAIENDQWPKIIQAYLACVSFADHYVGQVLDALERSPYADNTIVVLLSDHGYHLGEKNRFQKHSLWERSSHIPFVFAGPNIPHGERSDQAVGLIDLYPTLIELTGLPENSTNEGNSLAPLLETPSATWPHPTITEYFGLENGPFSKNFAVQKDTLRYYRYADGSEELYDHSTDINEWKNLANRPEFASIKTALRKHLERPSFQKPF